MVLWYNSPMYHFLFTRVSEGAFHFYARETGPDHIPTNATEHTTEVREQQILSSAERQGFLLNIEKSRIVGVSVVDMARSIPFADRRTMVQNMSAEQQQEVLGRQGGNYRGTTNQNIRLYGVLSRMDPQAFFSIFPGGNTVMERITGSGSVMPIPRPRPSEPPPREEERDTEPSPPEQTSTLHTEVLGNDYLEMEGLIPFRARQHIVNSAIAAQDPSLYQRILAGNNRYRGRQEQNTVLRNHFLSLPERQLVTLLHQASEATGTTINIPETAEPAAPEEPPDIVVTEEAVVPRPPTIPERREPEAPQGNIPENIPHDNPQTEPAEEAIVEQNEEPPDDLIGENPLAMEGVIPFPVRRHMVNSIIQQRDPALYRRILAGNSRYRGTAEQNQVLYGYFSSLPRGEIQSLIRESARATGEVMPENLPRLSSPQRQAKLLQQERAWARRGAAFIFPEALHTQLMGYIEAYDRLNPNDSPRTFDRTVQSLYRRTLAERYMSVTAQEWRDPGNSALRSVSREIWGGRIRGGSMEQERENFLSTLEYNGEQIPVIDIIHDMERTYGIPNDILARIIMHESHGDALAVSYSYCTGMGQLSTHHYRENRSNGSFSPFNPVDNLHAAARYVRYLLRRYRGSTPQAIAAYNAGEGTISRSDNPLPTIKTVTVNGREYTVRPQAYYNSVMAQRIPRAPSNPKATESYLDHRLNMIYDVQSLQGAQS